jgi:hypothetical protein
LQGEGRGKTDDSAVVRANEIALIKAVFADIWDHMSEEERQRLLASMNMAAGKFPVGGAAATAALLAGEMGGFFTYQLAVIVANFVVRALLGRGLAFATNAALTSTLSVVLGPIGWLVGGTWIAIDLVGPAYRKTVPAVVVTAALRQLVENRAVIGVLGRGSVGKDSLLRNVFGIETRQISPIPGSTSKVDVCRTGKPGYQGTELSGLR